MSLPEVLLWQKLRKEPGGFRFRRQNPQLEYCLDFASLETRLAIEVDGEHHSRGDRLARDAVRDQRIAELGFLTLRVPAKEILEDLNSVVTGIVATCRERGPSTSGLRPAVPLPVPGRNERMHMKSLLPVALLLAPFPALAQITPVAPIVKGTALPPPGTDEAAVLVPIDAIFAALAARDGSAIAASVIPDGRASSTSFRPDGIQVIRSMSWAEFAANLKPGPERYEERIANPAIEIDGDIAMVWAPYTFLIDGKVHHCGTDHFDLIRQNGAWKVLNITWNSRTTGCP